MKSSKRKPKKLLALHIGLVTASLLASGAALAQLTTATIRGEIAMPEASTPAGATVVAKHVDSGYRSRATTSENGSYVLTGLAPGSYEITITTKDGEIKSRRIAVQVGQSLEMDFDFDTLIEEVLVTAKSWAPELKTSEIGININRETMENFPQDSRNFLNFAKLAPGVRLSKNPEKQQFAAGALGASQTNYYIDGVNMKNNLLSGGGVGQDNSRGSPFSQLSVEGIRVITQNFKAEYEQAGSAIISAVTRSGGNEFEAEMFASYQDKGMLKKDKFAEERNEDKAEYERKQWGGAIGGPIIEDKLHYFASYEKHEQARQSRVQLGGLANDEDRARWGHLEGNYDTPFEEELIFGKLNYQHDDKQSMEFSVSLREEAETREIGGQNSAEFARDVVNDSTAIVFKHQYAFDNGALNEFTINYLDSDWAEDPLNNTPHLNYDGVIGLGGHTFDQVASQTSTTIRNNFTFPVFDWHGEHLVKVGFKYADYDYLQHKLDHRNPEFTFRKDGSGDFRSFPDEVRYAPLEARLDESNKQYGVFIQDDWEVTSKLTLNLGLRYDYETNATNQDFVTPGHLAQTLRDMEAIVEDKAALQANLEAKFAANGWMAQLGNVLARGIEANDPGYFDAERYITDGDDRDTYAGAFQPRIGFSYDLFDDQTTIIYGGAGRYVDRTLFNYTADETIRFLNPQYTINFSAPGSGSGVEWDPKYLNGSELDNLVTAGVAGAEMLLLPNDIEPVMSDQFSLGVRQQMGDFNTSLSFSYIKSDNDVSFNAANVPVDRPQLDWWQFFVEVPDSQVGNIIVADNNRKSRYKAMYITVDKPFDAEDNWGLNVAYTLASAKNKGNNFELDWPSADYAEWGNVEGSEKHTLVTTVMFGLPFDTMLSVVGTYGSGERYNLHTFDPNDPYNLKHPGAGTKDSTKVVDLKLSKQFRINDHQLTAVAEVFNVFDEPVYNSYESWSAPWTGDRYKQPQNVYQNSTRRAQLTLSYKF